MDILSETKEIIAAVLRIPVEKLDEKAEMTDVKGWDSIRNVMILAQLEEHFDVVFPSEDIFDMTHDIRKTIYLVHLLPKF